MGCLPRPRGVNDIAHGQSDLRRVRGLDVPAYAYAPGAVSTREVARGGSQGLAVPAASVSINLNRDGYTATTEEDIAAQTEAPRLASVREQSAAAVRRARRSTRAAASARKTTTIRGLKVSPTAPRSRRRATTFASVWTSWPGALIGMPARARPLRAGPGKT